MEQVPCRFEFQAAYCPLQPILTLTPRVTAPFVPHLPIPLGLAVWVHTVSESCRRLDLANDATEQTGSELLKKGYPAAIEYPTAERHRYQELGRLYESCAVLSSEFDGEIARPTGGA
jgi:hypothetical protein